MMTKYEAQRRALEKQGQAPGQKTPPDPARNAPPPAWRPKIRGSLLDALQRMAEQSGRDPNDLLDELLVTATSNDPAPDLSKNDEQDGASASDDGEAKRLTENEESDDAPASKMKGSAPNPLRRWAQGVSVNGEEPGIARPEEGGGRREGTSAQEVPRGQGQASAPWMIEARWTSLPSRRRARSH